MIILIKNFFKLLESLTWSILIGMLFSFYLPMSSAESVLDDDIPVAAPSVASSGAATQLATETIKKISESQKIFIVTNTNSSFGKGDFLTIIYENDLVARALCAKQADNLAGIKILKIYSEPLWKKMHTGLEVQILRGDDSFWKKAAADSKEVDNSKIKDEDDLYNTTTLEDDSSFDENKNRIIKTDNIVGLNYGWIDGKDQDDATAKFPEFHFSWSYQVAENIWGEALYGRGIMNDFPHDGLDTVLSHVTFRAKYILAGPLYSYFLPYVGYQMIMADSPYAGVVDSSLNQPQSYYDEEVQRVDGLKKSTFIFGVTFLKRVVPGWFVRADVGMDLLSVGASLEF